MTSTTYDKPMTNQGPLITDGQNCKALKCRTNLLQKMTSITPSIYKTIHQKVIFRNFDPYEGFRQAYSRPGPFTAIPSI